jgi:hypothetical protein
MIPKVLLWTSQPTNLESESESVPQQRDDASQMEPLSEEQAWGSRHRYRYQSNNPAHGEQFYSMRHVGCNTHVISPLGP